MKETDPRGPDRSRARRLLGMAAKTALVLALVILLNLALGHFSGTSLRLDISDGRVYTLSEQTISLLDSLENDVAVYLISETGGEDPTLVHLLEQFAGRSAHLTCELRDSADYPGFVAQYTDLKLPDNSLIVLSGDRSYVVHADKIYVADYEDYFETGTYTTQFCGESSLVSAIRYVSSSSLMNFYVMTGHGEDRLGELWQTVLTGQGAQLNELQLLSAGAVPEDCRCLLLFNPTADLTEDELGMVRAYLDRGGSLLLVTDYREEDLSRLHGFLKASYGVSPAKGIVLEDKSGYYLYGYPFHLLPTIEQHDITGPLRRSNLPVVASVALGLTIGDDVPESVYPRPLLLSSDAAYLKDPYTMTTVIREAGDETGQFALAVAIRDRTNDSRVVWLGTTSFLDSQSNEWSNGGNEDFIINCENWLTNNSEAISVHAKTVSAQYLTVPARDASALSVLFVGVVPLLFLAFGGIHRMRRRRR